MRILALTLFLILAGASAANAATITVSTTADSTAVDGKISIREALESMNAGADLNADVTHTGTYGMADNVIIPASANHYLVTAGELAATKALTITGAGPASTVLDARGASRVLHFSVAGQAAISGVTITGGQTTAMPGGAGIYAQDPVLFVTNVAFVGNSASFSGGQVRGGGALWLANGAVIKSSTFTGNSFTDPAGSGNNGGGAIMNSNVSVDIENSTFTGNSAELGSASNNGGGAVYQDGSGLTLIGDTFTGNSAQITAGGATPQSNGGGAVYQDDGILTILRSTFSGNTLSISGSSMVSGGGALFNDGTSGSLENSTFTRNSATPLGSGPSTGGGAILTNSAGALTITNATIDGNVTSGAGGNVFAPNLAGTIASKNTIFAAGSAASGSNCSGAGAFSSTGGNLEDSAPTQCGLNASGGDKIGPAPLLGALANNGGPTPTQELLPGSPAIDGGDNTGCPTSDQRGLGRPQGSACDVGALELLGPSAVTGGASGIAGSTAILSGTAANPNSLIGGTAFFQFGTTTAYGSQTAAQTLAPGAGPTSFSASASGLPAGTVIHFRAVASTPDGTSVGSDATFTSAPRPSLSALRIAPSRFRPEAGRGASIARKKGGAFVSYRDSQVATTTFTVQKRVRGFRSGRRCVAKRPRGHKKAKRCTLYKSVGSFKHNDRAGANRFHFSGRVKRRGLRPGSYRLRAVARESSGAKSSPRTTAFKIRR